jgi:tRNA(Ile)-lysidine synthase
VSVTGAVRETGLLRPGQRLVVLISGGCDSVCLIDVAATLCGCEQLRALHVNYGLRGPDSDADETLVRSLCGELGVALEVLRAPAPPRPGNLQAWARDLRYGAATRLALSRDARVATGHTASDQVETILYRLAASPGRRALLGMPVEDGLLVRPLLGVTREQTRQHCLERDLAWREDATNASADYARGRVRRDLVPALREVHPAAELNTLRSAELLREEAAVLDEVVSTALAGRDRIALAHLAELPPALARLVVVRLAEDAAGELVPGVGARVAELLRLGRHGGSAELDVGGGVRAVVEYGVLRMERAGGEPRLEPVAFAVPGSVRFGAWEIDCAIGPARPDDVAWAGGERWAGVLDADALGAELTVRRWRNGDRIAPLGLDGTKSLADLFSDRRVPRAERHRVPVVEAAGTIAWIPGVATAERFRVSAATRRTARMTARPHPA